MVRLPTIYLPVKIITLASIVATIDFVTPVECDVSALYGAVVIYASWYGGIRYGLATSAACIVTIVAIGLIQGSPFSKSIYFFIFIANRILIVIALSVAVSWYRRTLDSAIKNSQTDPLTSIANRRTLQERIELEINRARRNQSTFAFAYIDIDNFKTINDQMGHDVGDAVLVATAQAISAQLRVTDLAARVGGDEFCILLPDCSATEGTAVIHRLRDALQLGMQQQGWPITFSIGLVAFDKVPESVEQVISEADRLMYAAKHRGKDTIVHRIRS